MVSSNQPIHFEPNLGQAHSSARYVSRNAQYAVELGDAGLTLRIPGGAGAGPEAEPPTVRLQLKDRTKTMSLVPQRPLGAQAAYYVGNDASKWRTRIPTFGAVRFQDAWCGVDWLIQGRGRRIEHEFVLAPHAQLSQVRLAIVGADRLRVSEEGGLVIEVGGHEFHQRPPAGQQVSSDGVQPVGVRFVVDSQRREVGFAIESYPMHRLVIDPVLVFASCFGTLDAAPVIERKAA